MGSPGCWWPTDVINGSDAYEARVAEITRSTMETAMQLDVFGKETCADGDLCDRKTGWLMYSVERFYEAPLVWSAKCDGKDLRFKAVNNFKQASVYSGTYAVIDAQGDTLASGDVDFAAHWRETEVTAALSSLSKSGTIDVTNQYGDTTSLAYSC